MSRERSQWITRVDVGVDSGVQVQEMEILNIEEAEDPVHAVEIDLGQGRNNGESIKLKEIEVEPNGT